MVTARTAILLTVLLLVLSILGAVLAAVADPGADRHRADSFGTDREGYRGLFELLERQGVAVERQLGPDLADAPTTQTILLIAPDPILTRTEKRPLRQLADWVRRGGRLVIAPGFATADQETRLEQMSKELEHFDGDLLETLGLPGIRTSLIFSEDVPDAGPLDDEELVTSSVTESSTGPLTGMDHSLLTLGEALPEVRFDDDVQPLWTTRILDAQGDERILAAGFASGAGEIAVIADETLLCNVVLPRGKNAAWGLHLLLDGGRDGVVFDEFYHGLAIRGNSWWLLTRPQYASLAASGLLLLMLLTWRAGVLLGPPLTEREASRRSIGEYVDAMSRFLLRSRGASPFLLRAIETGVRRRIGKELGLPPAQSDASRLVATLQRRDPPRAARLQAALQASNSLLSGKTRTSSTHWLSAMHDLAECRTPLSR